MPARDENNAPQRYRILIVCGGTSVESIGRPLVVGQGLAALGQEVRFACSGPAANYLADAGFEVQPGVAETNVRAFGHLESLDANSEGADDIARCVDEEVRLIEAARPDVVVGECWPTLRLSCECTGMAYVNLMRACWTRESTVVPRVVSHPVLSKLCGRRAANWIVSHLGAREAERYLKPFNAVCSVRELPARESIFDLLESEFLNLLTDVPQFFGLHSRPRHYCYVGPALWEPEGSPPDWFGRLRNNVPTVYVTTGGTVPDEMFYETLKVLGNGRTQVVAIAAEPELPVCTLGNCFVDQCAAASKIIERSDLVICHGESTTVYRAIAGGVPVLGVPKAFSHETMMRRVEELGVGKALPADRLCGRRLADTINELLTRPGYRTRAGELAQTIRSYDAARIAGEAIVERLKYLARRPMANTPALATC